MHANKAEKDDEDDEAGPKPMKKSDEDEEAGDDASGPVEELGG